MSVKKILLISPHQNKKKLNLDARKLYYSGYILPLIDYCCEIWGNCSARDLYRILKVTKRAARKILDTDPLSPSLIFSRS